MKTLFAPLASVALLVASHAAETRKPEPFEDVLREAVKEYRAGKIDQAREALARATKILDDHRAGAVVNTFPEAPEGWSAGDVEKAEIPQVLGGGRTVKRTYREKKGDKEIVLEVIYDSSFGKLLMGLLVNDALAEAQGFKIRKIGGERALFKETADGGELNLSVDDSVLVKLTGKGGVAEKDLVTLARDVDTNSLKKVK